MSLKCFIIDDDPSSIRFLELILNQIEGIEITGSYSQSVKSTYEIVLRKPDVIFLDLMMPGLDGFELLETLESPPKIIIVSGSKQEPPEDMKKYICDYITKPVSGKQRILEALRKAEVTSLLT